MKRRLLIEAYQIDKFGIPFKTSRLICGHLDATKNITILFECRKVLKDQTATLKAFDVHIPEKIDHFNIIDGMITIYYEDGNYLEITRYFDDEPFLND